MRQPSTERKAAGAAEHNEGTIGVIYLNYASTRELRMKAEFIMMAAAAEQGLSRGLS